jgi:hypothetical protein
MKKQPTEIKQLKYEIVLLKSKSKILQKKYDNSLEVIKQKDEKLKKQELDLFLLAQSKVKTKVKLIRNDAELDSYLRSE